MNTSKYPFTAATVVCCRYITAKNIFTAVAEQGITLSGDVFGDGLAVLGSEGGW